MIILDHKIDRPPFETHSQAVRFMNMMRDAPESAVVVLKLFGAVPLNTTAEQTVADTTVIIDDV